jgi:hypothetical protein
MDELVWSCYWKKAQALTRAAMQVSAKSLAAVWDNPDDEAYNEL